MILPQTVMAPPYKSRLKQTSPCHLPRVVVILVRDLSRLEPLVDSSLT